tara:strand:- start:3143 stop:3436 length:294 start_codon:yes stop_codon:yes gene_type:complete
MCDPVSIFLSTVALGEHKKAARKAEQAAEEAAETADMQSAMAMNKPKAGRMAAGDTREKGLGSLRVGSSTMPTGSGSGSSNTKKRSGMKVQSAGTGY